MIYFLNPQIIACPENHGGDFRLYSTPDTTGMDMPDFCLLFAGKKYGRRFLRWRRRLRVNRRMASIKVEATQSLCGFAAVSFRMVFGFSCGILWRNLKVQVICFPGAACPCTHRHRRKVLVVAPAIVGE